MTPTARLALARQLDALTTRRAAGASPAPVIDPARYALDARTAR